MPILILKSVKTKELKTPFVIHNQMNSRFPLYPIHFHRTGRTLTDRIHCIFKLNEIVLVNHFWFSHFLNCNYRNICFVVWWHFLWWFKRNLDILYFYQYQNLRTINHEKMNFTVENKYKWNFSSTLQL